MLLPRSRSQYTRVESFFAAYDGGLDLLGPATHISLDRANRTLTVTGINAFDDEKGLSDSSLRTMVLREAPQFAQLTPKQHAVHRTAPPSLEQWAVALVANIDSLRTAASARAARTAATALAARDAEANTAGASAVLVGTTGPARRRSVRIATRAAARQANNLPTEGADISARASTASGKVATAGAAVAQAEAAAAATPSRAFVAGVGNGRYRQCAVEWLCTAGSAALITSHSARVYVAGDPNAIAANPTWREARLADDIATISKDYARFDPSTVVDDATRALFCGEVAMVSSERAATAADVRAAPAVAAATGAATKREARSLFVAGVEATEHAAVEEAGAAQAKTRRSSFTEADVGARASATAEATAAKVAEIVEASRAKSMKRLAEVGRAVLCASIYTHLEPGYCQGMHWIAAFCVCCSASLAEAENLFSTLVQRVLPRDFWSRPPAGMNGAIADAEVVRDVLLETQPALVDKHGEMMVGILAQVVGIKIMVPLFVGDIHVDTTRAIWDELFASCGVAVAEAAEAVKAAEAAEGDAVVFAEAAQAPGGATTAPAAEVAAAGAAEEAADGETAPPGAETPPAGLPATPHAQRKRRPSLREVSAERQRSHTVVTIAATLALFERVMPTLVAAEEGAFLMSAAESAVRTVTATEWRASYRAVLERNAPEELAERRRTVKRKLAWNWSQPSALRTLAGAQAHEAELAVHTPGKSSGVGAVVDRSSEKSRSGEGSARAAVEGCGTLSASAAFALSEIEIGVLQERFTVALADHIGGAYAGGVRRSEFDAVLDALLGVDANEAGETQRGDGWGDALFVLMDRDNDGTVSVLVIYRYILRESCSQFDSLPLTYSTISGGLSRNDLRPLHTLPRLARAALGARLRCVRHR